MIDVTVDSKNNEALSALAAENAMSEVKFDFPCCYMLVVNEAMAGLAIRITAVFPRLAASIDNRLGACEWKMLCMKPTGKVREYRSEGT